MSQKFLRNLRNNFIKLENTLFKTAIEFFVFNRGKRRRLKGQFCQNFLMKYVKKVESEPLSLSSDSDKTYRIWQYWNSGAENAPDLVKACLASVDKYRGNIERVILNDDNIKDYVTIPDYIYKLKQKGIISNTHFSDILRTYLLYEHGGCWIDATVLLTDYLPDYITQSELFVFTNEQKNDPDNLSMTSYFISSQGNSAVIAKAKRVLELYWEENNFLLNYFLFLHAVTLLMQSSDENKKECDKMYKFSYIDVQRMEKELLNKFSEERFEELKKISSIHKLSYKWKVIAKKKEIKLADTIYEYIIENFGFPKEYKGIGTPKKPSLLSNLKSSFLYYFSFTNIDDHYILKLFGAKVCIKHKVTPCNLTIHSYGVTKQKRQREVIVSLTTHPARINSVHQTISTLLNQTVKPDRVILWLATPQFVNKSLPESLTALENYGLRIHWYEEDIKSYKKLIPSLKIFPESIIITADDDIFYPANFVESLYNQYLKYPHFIHSNRAFVIHSKNKQFLIKARNYNYNNSYTPAFTNEFMTGYGVLFPPHSLAEEVVNSRKFMQLLPTNDDVWFWGMAVKNGTKICVNHEGYNLNLLIDRNVQDSALWKLNMNNTNVGIGANVGINIMAANYNEIKNNLQKLC